MAIKTHINYLLDVFPARSFDTDELSPVKTAIIIETCFSGSIVPIFGCAIYDAVCYPFEEESTYRGDCIVSWDITRLGAVNSILKYVVDWGIISGECIVLNEESLGACEDNNEY